MFVKRVYLGEQVKIDTPLVSSYILRDEWTSFLQMARQIDCQPFADH